jgi:hypothetical protein
MPSPAHDALTTVNGTASAATISEFNAYRASGRISKMRR